MKIVHFFLAPGYKLKTGYYYRAERDAEIFTKLYFDVKSKITLSSLSSFFKACMILFSSSKKDIFVCENIATTLPVVTVGFLIKRVYGKSILVYHGSLEDLRPYKFYYLKRKFYEFLERKFIQGGGMVVCVSTPMMNSLKAKYAYASDRVFVSPNIPSTKFVENIFLARERTKISLREELQLPSDKSIVCYAGNTQAWQKVEFLIDMIRASDSDLYFLILSRDLQNFTERLSDFDKNKYSLMSVDNDKVPLYLCASDFLYMIRDSNETNHFSCPTKGVEYLYSGTPLLCSGSIGDISRIVEENRLGVVVDPDDGFETLFSKMNRHLGSANSSSYKVPSEFDYSTQLDVFSIVVSKINEVSI